MQHLHESQTIYSFCENITKIKILIIYAQHQDECVYNYPKKN